MPQLLFGVPAVAWVGQTISKMNAIGTENKLIWNRLWLESYQSLGGKRTSGEKGCPRAAAYGLWFLGRIVVLD